MLLLLVGDFKMLKSIITFIILSSLLASCGSDIPVKLHKNYSFYVESQDPQHRVLFKELAEEYNSDVGFEALNVVDDRAAANSTIVMTNNLQQVDGKIGWGQWMTETVEKTSPLTLHMSPASKEVFFSMRVEFDVDYIDHRLRTNRIKDRTELRKLWCHEVGHGLQLEHAAEQSDVMYYSIQGEKDFDTYFAQVRSFFSRQIL